MTPPANLVAKCKPAMKLQGDTMGDIVDALFVNTEALNDCTSKHNKLSEFLTKGVTP